MQEVYRATEILVAISVFVQTIELLMIRHSFSDTGVWRWKDLENEFRIFTLPVFSFLRVLLRYKSFIIVLCIRLLCAAFLLFQGNVFLILFLCMSSMLIHMRWRGTFNGGSDYMTMQVLLCLIVSSFFSNSEKVLFAVLAYISIQLISSYFISGIVKLRRANWRSGAALSAFLSSTIYYDTDFVSFLRKPLVSFLVSWVIIFFELLFPLSVCNQTFALIFITLAFLFHVVNYYLFGLNRFIFAWAPCYPSLYYLSGLFE